MTLKQLAKRTYERLVSRRIRSLFYRDLIKTTNDFQSTKWLGQTTMQNPLDAWLIQETICELKPELLIECGKPCRLSLFYATVFDAIDCGWVITIDVQKMHDLSHPRITYLLGGSTSAEVVKAVQERAAVCRGPILVILDSDHSETHVRRELECYTPLVTLGSYCIVQDAVIDTMPIFRHYRPGPLPAIEAFMGTTTEFELDEERENRFLVTNQYKGWLKRIRSASEA